MTNEPHYDQSKESSDLTESLISTLLERTKQKGRGKALKTILSEAQAKEKNATNAKRESSSDEEAVPQKEDETVGQSHCGNHP